MIEFAIAFYAIMLVGIGLAYLVSRCEEISDRAIDRNNTWVGNHF